MVTKVCLVRHVQALGNEKHIFQGSLDLDLSQVGIKQLVAIKNYIKDNPVDVIYSSPLLRAKKTAQAIKEELQINKINLDDRLKEINLGKFEGIPIDEFGKTYPQPKLLWDTKPHMFESVEGEKMTEVFDRVKEAVFDIVSKNEGKKIAIVSHGCAIRNFMSYAIGRNIEFLNVTPWVGHGTVVELEFEDGEIASVNMLNIQAFD